MTARDHQAATPGQAASAPIGPGRAAYEKWAAYNHELDDYDRDLSEQERGQWHSIGHAAIDGSEYVRGLEALAAAQEPQPAPGIVSLDAAVLHREVRRLTRALEEIQHLNDGYDPGTNERTTWETAALALDGTAEPQPAPGDWWICDGPLPGAQKFLGPFATQELAINVRTYVEKAVKRSLWVDDEPRTEQPAPELAADPNHEPGLSECGCRNCDPKRHGAAPELAAAMRETRELRQLVDRMTTWLRVNGRPRIAKVDGWRKEAGLPS